MKEIRYTVSDEEYNKMVGSALALSQKEGKVLSVTQYAKKVALTTNN